MKIEIKTLRRGWLQGVSQTNEFMVVEALKVDLDQNPNLKKKNVLNVTRKDA